MANLKKRVMSLGMALVLTLSLLPVNALAKDGNGDITEISRGTRELVTGETTELFLITEEDGYWESSDERVALVDADGVVTAIGAGEAQIRYV